LLIEVWNKGMIWDKAAGYHWLHLRDIQHSNVVSTCNTTKLDILDIFHCVCTHGETLKLRDVSGDMPISLSSSTFCIASEVVYWKCFIGTSCIVRENKIHLCIM